MLDFRAVLSKLLYTFYSSKNGFNHDLRVVFYVGFSDFCKNGTDNQLVINKKAILAGTDYFLWDYFVGVNILYIFAVLLRDKLLVVHCE